jgi:phosphoglycolate phosphatase|tara:strand:- start:207 stop:860 length:654 start_codon:yes stop_codon:yes gene_type:complete
MKNNSYSFIFDLDGTLIDSLPDMYHAITLTINDYKLNPISQEKLQTFVGKGMLNLAEQVVIYCGGTTLLTKDFYNSYRNYYAEQPYKYSRFMPYVIETLDYFYNKNIIMSICTNKRQSVTERLVEQSGLKKYFKAIIGSQETLPLKPSPDMINTLIEELNISVDEYFMVGDTTIDMEAARLASIKSIGVLGGYTEESIKGIGNFTISNLKELKKIFK